MPPSFYLIRAYRARSYQCVAPGFRVPGALSNQCCTVDQCLDTPLSQAPNIPGPQVGTLPAITQSMENKIQIAMGMLLDAQGRGEVEQIAVANYIHDLSDDECIALIKIVELACLSAPMSLYFNYTTQKWRN